MKTTKLLAFALAAIVMAGTAKCAVQPAAPLKFIDPPDQNVQDGGTPENKAKAALMYINHLNYVVAKLGHMDDLFVLQQEYENLTDNNLNLSVINDDITVQLVMELMEAVKDLQKDNVKILYAQSTFEREKKAAIWNAIPQPAVFLAAPHPAYIAIAVAGSALTSVQNYYNAKAAAEGKYLDKLFEAGNGKLDHINEINKELFLAQWRLMHKYGISDNERITRSDSELFLGFADVLKSGEKKDIQADKLVHQIFRSHEDEMGALPFYWITRAEAARRTIDDSDLEYCCRKFFELYANAPIIRRDMDACAMALMYVSIVMKNHDGEYDKDWVRRWLKFVEKTVRIPEWQTKFCVAMLYREIGDNDKSNDILYKSLMEVYACIRVWENSKDPKRRQNIFRTTPALQKAYKDLANNDQAMKEALPDWEKESEEMVPYVGYVWLAGALFKTDQKKYKNIFNEMPVLPEKTKIPLYYIKGQVGRCPPRLKKKTNDSYDVVPNGAFEPGASTRVDKIDSAVSLKITTAYGIVAEFEYSENNLNTPQRGLIMYPWSNKAEELNYLDKSGRYNSFE